MWNRSISEYMSGLLSGDLNALRKVFAEQVSPNSRVDKYLNTGLHIAVAHKKSDVIRFLLAHNADLNLKNSDGFTPIQFAAQYGHVESLKVLAECAAQRDYHLLPDDRRLLAQYRTPLQTSVKDSRSASVALTPRDKYIAAVLSNDVIAVEELLRNGMMASIAVDDAQNRALHHAVMNRNHDMIRCLFEHSPHNLTSLSAKLNAKNIQGLTPIQLALEMEAFDCITTIAQCCSMKELDIAVADKELLVACGYQRLLTAKEKYIQAVVAGEIGNVRALLTSDPRLIDAVMGADGNTALHFAVYNRNLELIRLLVSSGANLLAENQARFNPIQLMLMRDFELFKEALQAGLKVDMQVDAMENRPLHYAITNRHPDLLRTLLERNVNLTARNKTGLTPIQVAVQYNAQDLLKIIAEACSQEYCTLAREDEIVLFRYGYKPPLSPRDTYIQAIQAGHFSAVKRLLERGVAPSIRVDKEMNTALHIAMQPGHTELLQILLFAGADISLKNCLQQTPIDLLVQRGLADHMSIVIKTCRQPGLLDVILQASIRAGKVDCAKMLAAKASLGFLMTPEGEELFQSMFFDPKWSAFIQFLFLERRPENIASLVIKFGVLPEALEETFADPISCDEIVDPVMTKHGKTYDRKLFTEGKNPQKTDPFTRGDILVDDLVKNHLFLELLAYYKLPNLDLSKVPPCLICPQTKKIYEKPVSTADGITYEEKFITDYLQTHNHYTPTGFYQNPNREPYLNRVIENLIAERYRHFKDQVMSPSVARQSIFATPPAQAAANRPDVDMEMRRAPSSFA